MRYPDILNQIKKIIFVIFKEIVFFLCALIATALLIFITHSVSAEILGLQSFAASTVVAVIIFLIKKKFNRRNLILIFIRIFAFVLIMQCVLIACDPLRSLVPEKLSEEIGLIHRYSLTECNLKQKEDLAHQIFGDRIDYNKVKIVNFRLGFNGLQRGASTSGNFIYTFGNDCIPVDTYLHEMTHVWQFQHYKNQILAFNTIPLWIRYYWFQWENPDLIYKYGNETGLNRAKNEGLNFRNFNIEQQAMIVQNFYYAFSGYDSDFDGVLFTENYKSLLIYYIQDMLLGSSSVPHFLQIL